MPERQLATDRNRRWQQVGDRVVRVPAVLLAVFVGLLTVLIGGSPAHAHNVLTGSNPADGAEVAEAPEAVRLTFLARLNPEQTTVTVTGPDGQPAFTGAPVVDGSAVDLAFEPGPAGKYTVDYNVLSADGHWVKGALSFTLTVGVEPPQPTEAPSPSPEMTSAAPTPTEASPSPASPEATSEQSQTPWWPWLVGGLVLLASAAAGAFFVRRRGA